MFYNKYNYLGTHSIGISSLFGILSEMSASTVSVRPLCPELEQKAKLELNETPKKLQEGIQHLKEWIAKQPHLRARTGKIFFLCENRL